MVSRNDFLESFGTGIQQILYILAKIAEKDLRSLLVEGNGVEFISKYQLELIKHLLVNMIEKTELPLKQLFFTTHSPALAYRSDFQIHNVTINSSGETSASRLGAAREVIADFYPDELKQLIVNQVVKKG
ncbi:MAG: hypothetical protein IPO03_03330 [Bacteroidetes bacterium]|nr:hypothetical protein [Bacteroidota bacterium]